MGGWDASRVPSMNSSDRAVGGLVGLLVGGVGYAWVAEGVLDPDTRWIWVPPLVLALAAAPSFYAPYAASSKGHAFCIIFVD